MVYCVWNNKGGVGKSFLSFTLSSAYAEKHKDKKIIVVDMCPQANLSEILLGGNGSGETALADLIKNRKTIGGYFDERIKNPHAMTGNETSYLIQVSKYNKEIPSNLHLIAGDPSLELQAQVINQISSQTLPSESWKNVHLWLKDIIHAVSSHLGNAITFVDCNPSFSAYTELSILASTNLIVPCTSDGSSARAINNLFSLIYGVGQSSNNYNKVGFSYQCKKFDLKQPILEAVLLNRSTQYERKASKAFGAVMTEIKTRVNEIKSEQTHLFSGSFDYHDIPDAHSAAIVSSHSGKPIHRIKAGIHNVHNTKPQVNKENLDRYTESINKFVVYLK